MTKNHSKMKKQFAFVALLALCIQCSTTNDRYVTIDRAAYLAPRVHANRRMGHDVNS